MRTSRALSPKSKEKQPVLLAVFLGKQSPFGLPRIGRPGASESHASDSQLETSHLASRWRAVGLRRNCLGVEGFLWVESRHRALLLFLVDSRTKGFTRDSMTRCKAPS